MGFFDKLNRMSLRKKQYVIIVVLGTGLLTAILKAETILGAAGLCLSAAGIILDVVWIRCPQCGTWLGKYPGDYCSSCGARIDWKNDKKGND